MSDVPDKIFIDKHDRDLYKKLDQEEMFKFKGGRRTRKEQFLYAMSLGFENKMKKPLEKRDPFLLVKDLLPKDEAIFNALAIFDTGSIEILAKKGEIYKIVEEYAHAGIKLLIDEIETTSFGSFDKKIEKSLLLIYKQIIQ